MKTNDDCRMDLLSQLGLPLLDCRHDHVSYSSSRQPVQASANASMDLVHVPPRLDVGVPFDGDDIEIASATVIAAVDYRPSERG